MLKLMKNITSWMVASFLMSTSVHAQDSCAKSEDSCPQPAPPQQMCPPEPPKACCPPWYTPVLNAAYNYPAATEVRCPWDLNAEISFIYWQPVQENMEPGAVYTSSNGQQTVDFINMNFDYKPGFKVGFGMKHDHDNWDSKAVYTWFHNENIINYSLNNYSFNTHAIYPTDGSVLGGNFEAVKKNWKLHMDLIDWDLGRSYFVGRKLTFRPCFGLRGAFIRQNADTYYTGLESSTSANTVAHTVKNRAHSWGVGLKTGVETNWLLGHGFRLFGNGQADILYTRYTKLSSDSITKNVQLTSSIIAKQKDVPAVRTHLDLNVGFGWGTYLDCNNWYLDFSAAYSYQVFFDQNMFRHFVSSSNNAQSFSPNGNLYVQGLTATMRLDF